MKIVVTVDFSPWSHRAGGAQRSSHYLAETIARRGHDVTVVFTKPPWESVQTPNQLPYKLKWATHHGLRSQSRTPLRPFNSISVRRIVQKELLKGIPTIVHCNGEEGALLHTLKKSFKFGLISTPRHPDFPKALYADHLTAFQMMRLAMTDGKYLAQRRAARSADLCIPPSQFSANIVKRALKVDSAKIRVVTNGVPPEFLRYHYEGEDSAEGPIIFFGRFNENKGTDVLVRAYSSSGLHKKHPLWLVGRGPLQKDLEKLIGELGLHGRARFLGWKTHDELASLLQTSAFVVLPSIKENFSLAVLGACCVGAPVISTTVGGTPEIIINNETGLLVEPNSVESLERAMIQMSSNREVAREMGFNASKRTRSHFTWETAANRFLEIYAELLGGMSVSEHATPGK